MVTAVLNAPIQVQSTSISEIEYDPEQHELRVEFARSGRSYTYQDVPEQVFQDFAAASSKGRFFVENVRDRYSF